MVKEIQAKSTSYILVQADSEGNEKALLRDSYSGTYYATEELVFAKSFKSVASVKKIKSALEILHEDEDGESSITFKVMQVDVERKPVEE
ncbi:hypothetical protein MUA33_04880 [Staphylococcus delphini]|uniref:hypothetical protein n=1 Tax=Staphylococcus delphini TaxID=53344 RepID=UPI0021CFCBDC|nr:hypothetical protein [Staphylococcus delphini]UXS30120.1 hypothetical protein MUA33_04880 [Staphylococcus delphini]UXS37789.1 hypothetical protein MUA34_05115 [Staphylococcus delphini]UXS45270.1 hypothetical protein MUA39_05240 [Staphylococcus delphini]UXV45890.1 hypothetical protein MUA63_05205 [Staphylococcus delphini]